MTSTLLLAQEQAVTLITWQERLLLPFQDHRMQLLCSVLIGGVLGLLGCFVVLRRMSLIGDAISHAVLPGVVIAFLLIGTGITGLLVGALLAGIATAIGISLVTRFSRAKEDAAIGIVFTAMFAIGVILISRLPSGAHFDLKCFLFGDPLAVQAEDLISVLSITPIVLGVIILLFRPLKLLSFDPTLAQTLGFNTTALHYTLMILLSASIVAALRSVGVIMAVAMLITPAATAYQLTNRMSRMLTIAGIVGAFSAGLGMFLAFLLNNPPGPMMVVVATLIFALAMAFSPERGIIVAWHRRRQMRARIVDEDVLKELARITLGERPEPPPLAAALAPTPATDVHASVQRLRRAGLLSGATATPELTDPGRQRALELLRAHRLWETYLAEHDVDPAYLHDVAERLEHAPGIAEKLAETMGQPETDPHGQPIPAAPSSPDPPR